LDLTLVRFGWEFNWNYSQNLSQGGGIIWVIGAVMVLMAPFVYLPTAALATLGVLILVLHNLWDSKTGADLPNFVQWLTGSEEARLGVGEGMWGLLHRRDRAWEFTVPQGVVEFLHNIKLWTPDNFQPADSKYIFGTGYGVLPSFGIFAAGYGLGAMFLLDRP